jgi:hypothetical protein
MAVKVSVNSYLTQVDSAAALRHELEPFALEKFREISLHVELQGLSLIALLNGNIGWLMYLRHSDGDAGYSSRNPSFTSVGDAPDTRIFEGRFDGEVVPLIEYQLSNGQVDEYPASWALPEPEIVHALEYFVEYSGGRPPFIHWHDDSER